MKPTNIAAPDYFHKVVDCQWACPAHTPVPEYIRLIAEGRYSDAYMINWRSNVFPGILGRTCDRPCEPACRRGRVEENPVAICRLKRVAADFKDDIRGRLPKPVAKNGKRIALVGGGPASLAVARDLAPLGYHCTVFDQDPKAGGMMRTQIPKFRLPDVVVDEETDYILNLGIEFKGGTRIDSMKKLLSENFDAIFVGSGAPRGRELDIPGRKEAGKNIHIGIDWLSNVSFGHVTSINKRVIVLGGGNTAMDCCRTARRLGGEDVKVIVRSGYDEMKASPWEKEDAVHEDIPILNFLVPKSFTHDNGKLTGVVFEKVKAEYDAKGRRNLVPTGEPDQTVPCDDVLVAVGQENSFPWIERDAGIEFDKWDMPKVDTMTMASTNPKVFFGGDAAFGPKNIIWAVAHGHDAALSIHKMCSGEDITERPLPDVQISSQKMGIHEWSYDNDISNDKRFRVPHRDKVIALKDIRAEVELGYDLKLALGEAQRCLNCDIQNRVYLAALHRMRRLRRHLPDGLHHLHGQWRRGRSADAVASPVREPDPGPLRRRRPEDRPGDGEGRGRLPALRAMRRTLPHRSVGHAEIPHRYDPRRNPMPVTSPISRVNDFVVRFANVNGSGSASANELFARSVLRMGVPVSPRNIFPSNIQGLPTWYEVRITEDGHLGARGGVDMMVAMNPQTWDKDVASIEPGGYLFYDSTKPMPSSKFREDITVLGVPLTRHHQFDLHRPSPAPAVQEHHLSRRAVGDARHGPEGDRGLISDQYKGKEKLCRPTSTRCISAATGR
jgi:NADPH-dependent glutamate synthase beta subunit-like oxidoreductase